MTSSQLRLFLARVFEDQALEDALDLPNADPVAIAASEGFTIDLSEYLQSSGSWEQWRLSGVHDDDY